MQEQFKNIIIRMPNWLGDAVMATPLLADIKAQWPDAKLTAMCQGNTGALLLGNPHLDEIFSFTRPSCFVHREQHRNLIARIRQGNYDLGVLTPNSLSSAWWLWRGGVKKRIGFTHFSLRRLLLSSPLPFPPEKGKEHLVKTYKRLLLPLGIPLSTTSPALYVAEEEKRAARQILKEYNVPVDATLIGVNPVAAYGSAKRWPEKRFRAVIEKLVKRPNTYVLCFADPGAAPLVHALCTGLPPTVLDLAGATHLRELIALIQQCHAFLSNDSGPMHIAAALQTPLVALFGSTNAVATGPYNHGNVINKQVACSPCYKRTCPIDFRCMNEITVEEVYTAVVHALQNPPVA